MYIWFLIVILHQFKLNVFVTFAPFLETLFSPLGERVNHSSLLSLVTKTTKRHFTTYCSSSCVRTCNFPRTT